MGIETARRHVPLIDNRRFPEGVALNHPFLFGIFHETNINKPSSYWGTPMTKESLIVTHSAQLIWDVNLGESSNPVLDSPWLCKVMTVMFFHMQR